MRSLALVTVLLAGCNLFFDDDDNPPCLAQPNTKGGAEGFAPQELLRNPDTGNCEGFGGGTCDDRCGPCPATDIAQPDWGSCFSQCEGLAETDCIKQAGCFAAYDELTNPTRSQFRGCWQTAPSGPVSTGTCSGLGAQECSRHDNCTAHYNPRFTFCADETPQAACATLATENDCAARPDCQRIYKGDDCTCTPDGCKCNILTYQRCEAR